MTAEFFFPPPRPLRRSLYGSYFYNEELTSDDPRDLNNTDELQEKVERMQAIIEHERNHPDEERYRSYSDVMQAALAELAPLIDSLNNIAP